MRAVIQRVPSASVAIGGTPKASINRGLLVLLGIATGDTAEDADWLAVKIAILRVFPDADEQMNLSVMDTSGDVLVISQFTLIASTRKGARPSYNDAARPEAALPLYHAFIRTLEARLGRPVPTGEFGAHMAVQLINDGPVTLVVDTRQRE